MRRKAADMAEDFHGSYQFMQFLTWNGSSPLKSLPISFHVYLSTGGPLLRSAAKYSQVLTSAMVLNLAGAA